MRPLFVYSPLRVSQIHPITMAKTKAIKTVKSKPTLLSPPFLGKSGEKVIPWNFPLTFL